MLGVGPLTRSAVVAPVPDSTAFRNVGQFEAWIGQIPRQHSSGGKQRLGGPSRCGRDTYLRCLLVQGAQSALQGALRSAPDKATRPKRWIFALQARIIWALLVRGESFDANAWRRHPANLAA
jgi:transposase